MYTFTSPSPLPSPQTRRRPLSTRRPPTAHVGRRMAEAYSNPSLHPVLDLMKRRVESGSKPGQRTDGRKLALCIEGGGMRGAVSAGMVAAIKYGGLENTFDVIYGSSAGSIVGAYFLSRQLPVYGAQIYYDIICSIPENGQRFIDLWALRHHPYLRFKKRNLYYNEGARPVLLLDRLIDTVMREQRPLHWKSFCKYHKLQPLKPVASSLDNLRATTLDSFTTFDEFLECLRASARVPGIAGNPVEIDGQFYADGLLCEPIPYRSALQDNCTDVLVLRTKPESSPLKATKPGLYEKHIAMPYFDRFPSFAPRAKASDYLSSGQHLSVYNDDIMRLKRENVDPKCYSESAIFSIFPPLDAPVVGQLESRPKFVYEGVRNGFRAAYDALSPYADPDIEAVVPTMVKIAKGEEKLTRVTAGYRAARWVFSDQELQDVEERHREARARIIEKKRSKRARRRDVRERKNKSRSGKKPLADVSKGRWQSGNSTIEEHYFVG